MLKLRRIPDVSLSCLIFKVWQMRSREINQLASGWDGGQTRVEPGSSDAYPVAPGEANCSLAWLCSEHGEQKQGSEGQVQREREWFGRAGQCWGSRRCGTTRVLIVLPTPTPAFQFHCTETHWRGDGQAGVAARTHVRQDASPFCVCFFFRKMGLQLLVVWGHCEKEMR